MAKTNIVLEGRHKDKVVCMNNGYIKIEAKAVTKDRVASYQVIDETNQGQYSFWKGALGVALLGGFGAVAGLGGKKKNYLIAIEWTDYPLHSEGNKSLVLLDEKYYQTFVRSMF